MNRHANSVLESAWAPENSSASLGFKHMTARPEMRGRELASFAIKPDALYGKAEVLARAMTSGDEEAEATAMALICVLVQDRVLTTLFDQQWGALPKFEAHVEQILEKVVVDLEASGA